MTDAAGHHRNVIDVSIGDHRFERVVSVARRELVFDVIVPTSRESLLRRCKTCAGEMTDEEFETAKMRKLRVGSVVVFTAGTAEGVFAAGIVVDRDERV